MEFENEMCQYYHCKKLATGSITILVDGFNITIFNCDKHVKESFNLTDKLSGNKNES